MGPSPRPRLFILVSLWALLTWGPSILSHLCTPWSHDRPKIYFLSSLINFFPSPEWKNTLMLEPWYNYFSHFLCVQSCNIMNAFRRHYPRVYAVILIWMTTVAIVKYKHFKNVTVINTTLLYGRTKVYFMHYEPLYVNEHGSSCELLLTAVLVLSFPGWTTLLFSSRFATTVFVHFLLLELCCVALLMFWCTFLWVKGFLVCCWTWKSQAYIVWWTSSLPSSYIMPVTHYWSVGLMFLLNLSTVFINIQSG